jgi:glycosyltransferase involved in cell wall biosynthesis
VRSVLIVAYHFPPFRGSSGIQRTLRFCRYLPEFGWEPALLTVNPRAYETVGFDLTAEVPAGMTVARAFALDAARHLAFRGVYPRVLATPDRWSSWFPGGVVAGLRLIWRHRPQVLFSTYPIATAHLIALTLHRITGIPWVADFRDPMAQDDYPDDPVIRRRLHRLEAKVAKHAARVLFTSVSAMHACQARYPGIPADRWKLLENGYDEEAFAGLAPPPRRAIKRLVLLHSGIVYASERDPTSLFAALSSLKRTGRIDAARLEVRFRASANDAFLRDLAARHDIADLITLGAALPYREALKEMTAADALLLLQAANCNGQTPAKVYEYLRAGRPILALTDADGDTAALLHCAGLSAQAPLDSATHIAEALRIFLEEVRAHRGRSSDKQYVVTCSRFERTRTLSHVFDDIAHVGQ